MTLQCEHGQYFLLLSFTKATEAEDGDRVKTTTPAARLSQKRPPFGYVVHLSEMDQTLEKTTSDSLPFIFCTCAMLRSERGQSAIKSEHLRTFLSTLRSMSDILTLS